ncbi:hypothetical protein AVEN_83816-1 [Araneus ventricosus]|uniref:Uncharacterized protein n=1 Tax=Araneus ventricosus TaxID=182803 RepID=A0A4Y2T2Z0_ARAVE|nr:hypothetical protein AVEN_83816-1 [Araneus ventricosus]
MDSLPKHMVHLRDGLFTLVNSFLKETRVHILIYTTDDDGVSLKREVWRSLLITLRNFPSREDSDAVYVIKKNVCIFNNTVYSEKGVTIQRLFQRKESGYKLVTEKVLLKGDQITRLCTSYSHIFEHVKTSLLTYTLGERIRNEIKKIS